jgi:hypothetical protein
MEAAAGPILPVNSLMGDIVLCRSPSGDFGLRDRVVVVVVVVAAAAAAQEPRRKPEQTAGQRILRNRLIFPLATPAQW